MRFPNEAPPALTYPTDKFSVHDPHHVTLQLLQEVHSQRMQMQIDRDREREMRRQTIEDNHQRSLETEGRHSNAIKKLEDAEREVRLKRDSWERRHEAAVKQVNELLAHLRKCAELGRGIAQQHAAKEIARWK